MLTTSLPPSRDEIKLDLLERWLTGWSLARGAPLPRRHGGGLVVEVGHADQLRRHLFVDAGAALQDCARSIEAPCIFLKATVDMATLRQALPPRWQIETARYLMRCDDPMAAALLAPGYREQRTREHGASVLRLFDGTGAVAASGQLVIHGTCAIFDRIETAAAHRRRGLARYLMGALDAVAQAAGVDERLLVATEAGRALYLQLGWQVLAPYSTALLASRLPDCIAGAPLRWRQ